MVSRRDVLRLGLATGTAGLVGSRASAQNREWLRFLCPPDDRPRELPNQVPSPPARPWAQPLFAPPIMQPVRGLTPPPVPAAHQRYFDFKPRKFYEIREREFQWSFHPDAPYTVNRGGETLSTWVWGFSDGDGPPSSPGPTYDARYGEPILVRRYNDLPPLSQGHVKFALPSTTTHLHNAHTASESDGNPQDWIDPGEFWDHQYGNFPSGNDPREKLTTLWYHDHRLDFTAANVYSGLFGFYRLFDEQDNGDENDPNGWQLPSGDYDVPLVLEDMKFELDENGVAQMVFDNWNTDGMIGDRFTVNRKIQPYFKVEARKYRFRILNGGPSRFYQLFLRDPQKRTPDGEHPYFTFITGDGNFLPEPVVARSVYLSVAQRVDFVIDFSKYQPGDQVFLHNLLDQRVGSGPANRPVQDPTSPVGRPLDFDDPKTWLLRFDVVPATGPDPSRVPDFFRPLPKVDLSEVKHHRTWEFDYDGGLWTINERIMDPGRIDAGIEQGSAEIWTFVNGGNDWAHPIHSHFTEFLILEVNGKPFRQFDLEDVESAESAAADPGDAAEEKGREFQPYFLPEGGEAEPQEAQDTRGELMGQTEPDGLRTPTRGDRKPLNVYMGGPRRDVATLLPGDEVKVFMRWKDFLGKHVMHCHNVVHEDHAMMIRWDIMEPGRDFSGPRRAEDVYGDERPYEPPFPDDRPPAPPHQEIHPSNPVQAEGDA